MGFRVRALGRSVVYSVARGAVLCVAAAIVFERVWTLRIEYYDGYDYLLNAKQLAGLPGAAYNAIRPPLVSLLQMPLVRALHAAHASYDVYLIAPHALAAIVSLWTVIAVMQLARRGIGQGASLVAGIAYVSSRYFVHYAPFVLTDLATAGWVAWTTSLHARATATRSLRAYAWTGASLGAAVLTKYTLVLLAPAMFATEIVRHVVRKLRGEEVRRSSAKNLMGLGVAFAVAATAFGVTHAFVFATTRGPGTAGFFETMVAALHAGGDAKNVGESPLDYLSMTAFMLTPVVTAYAGLGVAMALVKRNSNDLALLCGFAGIGLPVVFALHHTEARYALPFVPFIVCLAARASMALSQALTSWMRRSAGRFGQRLPVGWLPPLLLLVPCVMNAADQIAGDRDVFFSRRDILRAAEVATRTRERGHDVFWLGGVHAAYPAHIQRAPNDEFYEVFHFAPFTLSYFTGFEPRILAEPPRSSAVDEAWIRSRTAPGDMILRGPDVEIDAQNVPVTRSNPLPYRQVQRAPSSRP